MKPGGWHHPIPMIRSGNGSRSEPRQASLRRWLTQGSSRLARGQQVYSPRTYTAANSNFGPSRGGRPGHHRDSARGHLDNRASGVLCDTHEQLAEFVGKPVLNKIDLIINTRNCIDKARIIVDTKQSGVKLITAKTQRVSLPRLFDVVSRMFFMLSWFSRRANR